MIKIITLGKMIIFDILLRRDIYMSTSKKRLERIEQIVNKPDSEIKFELSGRPANELVESMRKRLQNFKPKTDLSDRELVKEMNKMLQKFKAIGSRKKRDV